MARPRGPQIPDVYRRPRTKIDTPVGSIPDILNLLSDELLLQIIEYVGCSTEFSEYGGIAQHGPKQLQKLASCSRRLHKITLPVLYSHYREHQEHTDTATKENCLQLFLCQILEKPELANYVQVYHGLARDNQDFDDNVVDEDYWHDDDSLDMSSLEEKHWEAISDLLDMVTNHDVDEAAKWGLAIKRGSWDATTAFLLSILPNLEELEFEGYSYTDAVYPYIMRVLSRAKSKQERGDSGRGSLHKLSRVALEYWDTECGLSLNLLVPYLTLPSVESFYGRMLDQSNYDEDDRSASLRAELKLQTKTLYLVHSSISQDILEVFFGAFDSLERLIYDHHTVGNPEFEPPRVMAALSHLAPTLKELTLLNLDGVGASSYENFPVGSLRGCEKLKKLDMNARMLIGFSRSEWEVDVEESWESEQNLVDSLPPNLEYLRLRSPGWADVPFITSFVSSKSTNFPNLRTLELGWERIQYPNSPPSLEPFIHPGFTKEEAMTLWELCKKMGVEIPMKIEPPRWKSVSWRDKELRDGLISTVHTRSFEWPYEGYEELCREMGCEVETGRRRGEMC
ncbi:hypothetical protein B0J14DRAFT_154060 [Halenospora varia]|nr:hypothetical protein B0J14DRAFT_154060 [Halenospora varia]